ncbi:MAG: hypothetical protein DSZ23_05445 [Thermodesulfatator sp.]|nr:MAG: hypothetical protein DSZ23_05445 [Thermodesulfatator sp.]
MIFPQAGSNASQALESVFAPPEILNIRYEDTMPVTCNDMGYDAFSVDQQGCLAGDVMGDFRNCPGSFMSYYL